MENIELNQYNRRACFRTTLKSNHRGNACHFHSNVLNIDQFKQGLSDQLNRRMHNTLLDYDVKMNTANKLRIRIDNIYLITQLSVVLLYMTIYMFDDLPYLNIQFISFHFQYFKEATTMTQFEIV